MNKLLKRFLDNEPQSGKSFAAFRIMFCLFILVFIVHINYYRPLIFNSIPHLVYNPFPAKLFLVIWGLAAGMLLFGWHTRIAAVINYLFVIMITFLFSNTGCGSFNDDLLRIGSFLLIIMPAGRHFSVDAVCRSIRYGYRPPVPASTLYYNLALFVSLGLMYLASAITKLSSPMWQKGLGLWIPASMPYNKWHPVTFFLDMEWLMVGVNYVTVAWELLFIFFIFSKKWRTVFAVTGLLFHAGIAAIFPFPLLCLGPATFYVLFIPDRFWQRFRQKDIRLCIDGQNRAQVIFAQALTTLNGRTVTEHYASAGMTVNSQAFSSTARAAVYALNLTPSGWLFSWLLRIEPVRLLVSALIDDGIAAAGREPGTFFTESFRRFWLLVFCITLLSVQLFYTSYHIISKARKPPVQTNLSKETYFIRKDITDLSLKPSNLFRTLFGLNARGVFLDHSNTGSKTVFAVVRIGLAGDTTWLPYFDRQGYALGMNRNLAWSKYTFNSVCSGSIPNPYELEKTLWLWAGKNAVSTRGLTLHVLKRTYIYPHRFEPGYHQQLAALPWLSIATVEWPNDTFTYIPVARR